MRLIELIGSPARIGPNLLVTDDADVLRHMAATESGWSRSEWYIAMKSDPRCDSVFSTRDEKMHAELKVKEAAGVGTLMEAHAQSGLTMAVQWPRHYES